MSGSEDEDLFGSDPEGDEVEDLFGSSDSDAEDVKDKLKRENTTDQPNAEQDHVEATEEVEEDRKQIALGPVAEVNTVRSNRFGAGQKICALKLPAWLLMEAEPFDRDAELKKLSGCSKDELKQHEAPRIRWKHGKSESGDSIRHSNARVVTWSDGSMQLLIGNEVLEIAKASLDKGIHYLFSEAGDVLRCQTEIESKLIVQARQSFPVTRRKPSLVQSGIKKMYTTVDPEIEAERRAKRHMQNQAQVRRQERRRYLPPQEFSSTFLERDEDLSGDESSEEEFEPRRASMRRRYSDDMGSDDDMVDRLHAAKKGDPVRGKAVVKKRVRQVESPPEEVSADEAAIDDEDELVMRSRSQGKKRRVIESDSE